MSDSGAVELTRDCGLEGVKRITCSGKQDNVDLLRRALMCLSERENEEHKSTTDKDVATTVAASAAATNANEPISDQIEKPVEKSINGDIPIAPITEMITPGKPYKSPKKIASEKPLKNNPKLLKKYKLMLNKNMDDMMMGDQPVQYIPKIEDPLPHTKKALHLAEPEHSQPTAQRNAVPTVKQQEQPSTTRRPTTGAGMTSPEKSTRSRRNSETASTPMSVASTEATIATSAAPASAATTEASSVPSTESTSEKGASETTPTVNSTRSPGDHFIPPMLLVHHDDLGLMSGEPKTAASVVATTTATAASSTESTVAAAAATEATTTTVVPTTAEPSDKSTQPGESVANTSPTTPPPETVQQSSPNPTTVEPTAHSSAQPAVPSAQPTVTTVSPSTTGQTIEAAATSAAPAAHEHSKPSGMMRPHAPKHGGEIHFHAPNAPTASKVDAIKTESSASESNATAGSAREPAHLPARNPHFIAEISNDMSPHDNKTAKFAISTNSVDLAHTTTAAHDAVHGGAADGQHGVDQHGEHQAGGDPDAGLHDDTGSIDEAKKRRADFTNSDMDYVPYKPNRRRVLRKPQAHSYIQRVFGRR